MNYKVLLGVLMLTAGVMVTPFNIYSAAAQERLKCEVCAAQGRERTFKTFKSLENHLTNHINVGQEHKCQYCGQMLKGNQIVNHYHNKHFPKECQFCRQIFNGSDKRASHITNTHPEKIEKVTCPLCGVNIQRNSLSNHKKLKHGIRNPKFNFKELSDLEKVREEIERLRTLSRRKKHNLRNQQNNPQFRVGADQLAEEIAQQESPKSRRQRLRRRLGVPSYAEQKKQAKRIALEEELKGLLADQEEWQAQADAAQLAEEIAQQAPPKSRRQRLRRRLRRRLGVLSYAEQKREAEKRALEEELKGLLADQEEWQAQADADQLAEEFAQKDAFLQDVPQTYPPEDLYFAIKKTLAEHPEIKFSDETK